MAEADTIWQAARLLGETRAELVRRVVLDEARRVQAVHTKMIDRQFAEDTEG
jgi:hypothetical protein